jgi:4-carboxymuconolactone decarboxylase
MIARDPRHRARENTMTSESSAYDRGLDVLRGMFPERERRAPGAPEEIRQDWGRLLVELYGAVWARPALPLRSRSLITVAALTALHLPDELRLHTAAALRNGLSRRELAEVVMHAAGYAGFPKGVEGMRVLREIFDANPDLDPPAPAPEPAPDWPSDPFERGTAFRRERFGQTGRAGNIAPAEIIDDWWQFLTGTAFGGLWPRPGLALHDHSRVTLAVLQVLHLPVEFRLHLGRALGLGIGRDELCEQIMHLALYGGFPTAVEAMRIAREVFEG